MLFYIKTVVKLLPFFWELVMGKNTGIKKGIKTNPKGALLILMTVGSLSLSTCMFKSYVDALGSYKELEKRFKALSVASCPASEPAVVEDRVESLTKMMREIKEKERGGS